MYSKQERDFLRQLGASIDRLREKRKMTQERLAFEANIYRTYIGDVERGTRNTSAINLAKTADALGVSLREVFTFHRARKH